MGFVADPWAGVADLSVDFSSLTSINFNNVWSRENYLDCNETDEEKMDSKPYPILNSNFHVSPEKLAIGFNQKIPDAVPAELQQYEAYFMFILGLVKVKVRKILE